MSKAAELAALIGSQTALSNRNLIINGASQIWQRGTSVDTISTGGILCDRWRIGHSGTDGNVDVDQDTSVPTGKGFGFSQKISMDASESSLDAGDQVNVTQKIEAQNLQHLEFGTSSAKSLVLSFYVKSSVAATYTVEWLTRDGTQRMIGRTYTINSANTWEYKTLTIPGDPSATINNDNGIGLEIRWWMDAGSTYTGGTFATDWENKTNANRVNATTGWLVSTSPTWHITGVQLEIGEQATPFEHRSFGDELAACKRYFEKSFDVGTTPGVSDYNSTENWTVNADGSGNAVISPSFKVEKRAAPTMVAYQATGATGSWNYFRDGATGTGGVTFDRIGTNTTRCYTAIGANWASGSIFGHWTADAEL
jgi:hypothetical protein